MSAQVPQIIASGSIASRDTALPATTIATAPAAGMYRVNVTITLSEADGDVDAFITNTSSAGEQTNSMGGQFLSFSSGQQSAGGSYVLESVADADIQLSTSFTFGTPTYVTNYSVEAL